MAKKVIIFSAPPSSGKDIACEHLKELYPEKVNHLQFKTRLIELTQAFFMVSPSRWKFLYQREYKEKPTEFLSGLSPRNALIHISENVIKPYFGNDYFGKALADSLKEGWNIVSDGGFESEMIPVIEEVGIDNFYIVQIKREGFTFEGDSRNYIDKEKLNVKLNNFITIYNDRSKELFLSVVEDVFNKLDGE